MFQRMTLLLHERSLSVLIDAMGSNIAYPLSVEFSVLSQFCNGSEKMKFLENIPCGEFASKLK